jgi:hypothetical protein
MLPLKTNASRYDLNDKLDWYEDCVALLKSHNRAHGVLFVGEAWLVSFIKYYFLLCEQKHSTPFKEQLFAIIDAWCSRTITNKDRLVAMLEGKEPLKFEKTMLAEKPFFVRPSGGLKQLADIPAPGYKPKTKPSIGKLPKGYFTKQMAIDWMMSNKPHDLDLWDQYFTYYGVRQGSNEEIYILNQTKYSNDN